MLLIANNTQQAKQLSKQYLENRVRKIHQGIYTDDLTSPLDSIVQSNWRAILHHIVPQGILGYRTAVDLKPLPFKNRTIVFVISSYTKTIDLPGLTIKVYKGDNSHSLEPIFPELARSNTPRMLLENLTTVRGADYIGIKTIGVDGVEEKLAKELCLYGEKNLNRIRSEANDIAQTLGLQREYKKLSQIISALLSTHTDKNFLTTAYARAAAQKKPYDTRRIQVFDELIIYLKQCYFIDRQYHYCKTSFKNLSFYESYFSNFIEGTQFMIDEAEDIVFAGKSINNRYADSHDILASFLITNDYSEMSITPESPEEFINILQRRHAILMKERPEKRPGEFKQKFNRAGNTIFVTPKETLGTLYQGFERYQYLKPGLEKALFMQFMISEVHPFDDGNGRLARLMMNAELVNHASFKIIIPSVHRDNYLGGLRLASRDSNFRTYVKVMDQAQAYTASINWGDYGEAREKLEMDNANLDSDEGIPIFNRALKELKLSDISV
jgi:hypothetical protein